MKVPKISVVIPVFNCENFIREAINSVLHQDYDCFELLIMDDCSTDATFSIISEIKDERLRIYRSKTNRGPGAIMNELCLIAQGDYIAVMHGDDICFPNRLSLELNFLEKNSPIDVVFGKFVEVNEAGAIIRTVGENSYPVNHLDVELSMYFSNCICHPTVMFKRSILNKFCYNSEFRVTEDYKFWTDILIGGGKFGFLEKELIKYRIHLNQGSSKFNSKMLNEVDIIRNEYVSLSNPTFSKIINLMNSGQICSVDEIMKIFKDTLFEDNERRWFSDRLDHWVNLGVKSGNLTFNDILIYALKMGPLRKVNVKNIIHFILAKL